MKKFFLSLLILSLNFNLSLADNDIAQAFVNNTAQKVIAILNNAQASDQEKEAELITIFTNSVDINWIGRFALGKYAKTLNDEQRSSYNKAFREMLIDTYIPSFRKYTKESFEITNVIASDKGEYLVQTEILRNAKQKNLKVDYAIKSDANNNLKIFDIVAEGVSLINTKRNEFSSILSTNNIGFLIRELSKKFPNSSDKK